MDLKIQQREMKNKGKIIIGLGVLLSIVCVTFFSYTKYSKINNVMKIESENENANSKIIANVMKGDIAQKYSTKGCVISQSPELYTEELEIQGASNRNLSMIKNKGEDVAPKEEFYIHNGRRKSVDFNGKILDVAFKKDIDGNAVIITLLNYDKLRINTKIGVDELQEINYDTQVEVFHKGEKYNGKISLINYEIENGEVLVQISTDGKLYPGSNVYVDFIKNVKQDKIYVPEKAVIKQDGKTYAVLSKDGKENEKVEITIGETFYERTSGNEETFIEVISGLKEGDLVEINLGSNKLNMEEI